MKTINPNRQFAKLKKERHHILKQRWLKIKNQYLEQYPILTNEDPEVDDVNINRLVAEIARKTGRSNEMVIDEISSWNYEKKKINTNLGHQKFSLYKRISY